MLDYKSFGVAPGHFNDTVVRTKRTPMTQFDTLSNDSLDVLMLPTTEYDPKTDESVEVITIITDVPQRNVLILNETMLCHLKEYPAGTVAYTAGCTRMYQKDVNGRWIDFDTGEAAYTEPAEDEGGEGGGGGRLNDDEIE